MPNQPVQLSSGATSRAEKMSILSTLLGPEALAKIREGQPESPSATSGDAVEINADRAAWHRNKLLERLRVQSGNTRAAGADAKPVNSTPREAVADTHAPQARGVGQTKAADSVLDAARKGSGLDMRLAAIADPNTFDQEHPAVIARLLRGLSREERIVALKSLPGPIARSIVRRLR